jgi:hypothetical protein
MNNAIKSRKLRLQSFPAIFADEAKDIADGKSPTEHELFAACISSIWTSAIAGSTSIGQAFESADTDEKSLTRKLVRVARRLRKMGYTVELGAGAFIDIDWTRPYA